MSAPGAARRGGTLGGTSLDERRAPRSACDFRQGAFRFGMSNDTTAMMGGGLCWLDYDADGWLDLFVVNSYAQADIERRGRRGAGFRAAHCSATSAGRFEDVSSRSGADSPASRERLRRRRLRRRRPHRPLRDDGRLQRRRPTDTTRCSGTRATGRSRRAPVQAGINAHRLAFGRRGRRRERRRAPRPVRRVLHGPELAAPASPAGFPTNHQAVRDLLYLNEGAGRERPTRRSARSRGARASSRSGAEHGLGAVFTDVDRDGRLDLYVANDADPNQLYGNVPGRAGSRRPCRLGFRFVEVAKQARRRRPERWHGHRARPTSASTAGPDLFVTNSRGQLHAAYRSRPSRKRAAVRGRARRSCRATLGTRSTGWGASWADLDLDGDLDLVVANGAIPVRNLAKDAQRVQVLENRRTRMAAASVRAERRRDRADQSPRVNGRGLAAADYDNDGDIDVAVNSIGGTAAPPREPRDAGTLARGAARAVRARERSSPPCSRTGAGSSAKCSPAAATCPPRIPACTSGSGTRPACRSFACASRTAASYADGA